MVVAQLKNGETHSMSMKKKNPSLTALESSLAQEVTMPEIEPVQEKKGKRDEPPKKKKIQLPTYPPAAVHEQLRRLAFEERTSINALTLEAWDLLFKSRGLKSIKDLVELDQ
jgi:hypothetical protein